MWKDYLYFSKSERRGVIVLLVLIVVSLIFRFFIYPIYEKKSNQAIYEKSEKWKQSIITLENQIDYVPYTDSYYKDSLKLTTDNIERLKSLQEESLLIYLMRLYELCWQQKQTQNNYYAKTQNEIYPRIAEILSKEKIDGEVNINMANHIDPYEITQKHLTEDLGMKRTEVKNIISMKEHSSIVYLSKLYELCYRYQYEPECRNIQHNISPRIEKAINTMRIYK